MGWLKNLFIKPDNKELKENKEQVIPDKNKEHILPVKSSKVSDFNKYVRENSEIITESHRLIEEAKTEYQAVTSYLTDIQKIDMIPMEQRGELEEAASNIVNLSKEREMIQNRKYDITDTQYRLFERYEMQIPKELTAVKEAESYQESIESDLKRLEQEKQNFLNEKDEIAYKQTFLKGIAVATCVIIVLLFAIFAILTTYTNSNMTLPFLLTVLMGMATALYIFMEARKNANDIQLVRIKLNKVIMLANKVTIKSVNNRNYLDYIYNKYMVDNYEQFKNCWEQFVKIKDENKKYRSNSQLLEYYYERLINELKRFGVNDAEIWIYQPSAILDSREMVEIRHRLNVRRQKLRERIDTYQKQKEEAAKNIISMIKACPERKDDAIRILDEYKIRQDVLESQI
mgnify:FL=1